MAANKKNLKKKLDEKRLELLLCIIEEEINLATKQILKEEPQGGVVQTIGSRSELPGVLFSPITDLATIAKRRLARATTIALRGIGSFIGGAIATLLPFNDPRTVDYINQKFKFWEQESLKFIDEQFKPEMELVRSGWETFKNDFWGIGFVASPFGAIAAAATAAKGVDAGLSVANVITGGKVGAILDKINVEVKDPGDLDSFLKHGKREDEEKARHDMEKKVHSARCLAQIETPNWIDPECLGFAKRNMFPPGEQGQAEYIDFVTGNLNRFNRARRDRYKIEFGKDPGYHYGAEEQDVINVLKQQGLISENYIHEAAVKQPKDTGVEQAVQAGMARRGPASKVPASTIIKQLETKFGKEKTQKLLAAVAKSVTKNPQAKAMEQAWVTTNLPNVATATMNQLNKDLASGQVPAVTPEQVAEYKAGGAGDAAEKAIVTALKQGKNKGKVPPAALQAVKAAVDASAKTLVVPVQPQAAQPAAPQTQAAPAQPVPVPQQPKQ